MLFHVRVQYKLWWHEFTVERVLSKKQVLLINMRAGKVLSMIDEIRMAFFISVLSFFPQKGFFLMFSLPLL